MPPATRAEVRRLFFAEHWKVGTIAAELGLHPDTVRRALDTESFNRSKPARATRLDSYLEFIRATLQRYPRLRATRLYQMIQGRGYEGSVVQLRRLVRRLRPVPQREAFLKLRTFPGEQGQVDWAHFGTVRIGRAQRRLSGFVMTLSYSRALALEFFFDQSLENFLRGHVRAFAQLGGVPRTLLYDNLRSAVLARHGDAIQFHPRLLELCAHYHFEPRPCRPRRGNEKGRVERVIRYVRDSFFAARPFTTLDDLNRQAGLWRDRVAHTRPWPGGDNRRVEDVCREEQDKLLSLPVHPFDCDLMRSVQSKKTIYVRFDLNDYSIPPAAVGKLLTLVASDQVVRLLDGTDEVARHRRSYDRHETIVDPAHEKELLTRKRRALGATPNSRLVASVPESEALLEAAFRRGEPIGSQVQQLVRLLDDYGPRALQGAVREALARETPRASSVAFLLRRQQRGSGRPPLPVHLTRRPDLEHLHVPASDPEVYDELTDEPDTR